MGNGRKVGLYFRGKMVKTRHSGDLDESLDDEFKSLRPRGTRGKSLFSAQNERKYKKAPSLHCWNVETTPLVCISGCQSKLFRVNIKL